MHRHPTSQLERAAKIGCGSVAASVSVLVIASALACALEFRSWNAAKNHAALLGAKHIAQATELFLATCSSDCPPCPSVDDLAASRTLDRRKRDDPWGQPYQVVCTGDDDVWVYSFGRDRVAHTADDIASDMPESNLETLDELSR